MNSPLLTVVGWLWRDPACRTQYTLRHANIWARMIHRNLTRPHRFVLLTDQPGAKYDRLIEPMQLWPDWHLLRGDMWREEFPQCYVRLKAFSREMREVLGPRFVSIDLDCVVTGNLDDILGRTEDFLICKRARVAKSEYAEPYQASMWMMDAGARAHVWESFRGPASLERLAGRKHEKIYKKTDQGWMIYQLGKREAVWTMDDGVYHWPWLRENELSGYLPKNARIIFFQGREKPWNMAEAPMWVRRHYR